MKFNFISTFSCLLLTLLLCLSLAAQSPNNKLNDPTFWNQFETYALKAQSDWQVPGMAIAVVKDNQIVYLKAFGVKDVRSTEKVDTDTIFQIGSISKGFTTVLTGIAVDHKIIEWQDQVVKYLPTFKLKDPWVTREFQIIDLFSQYSGLKEHTGDSQALLGIPATKIIQNLQFINPVTSFRSSFAYQNIFFNVGAEVLYERTNQTWGQLLQTHIFLPLKMRDTTTTAIAYLNASNKAEGHYTATDGKIVRITTKGYAFDWVYNLGPAGGINSNIKDMSKWLTFLVNAGTYENRSLISSEQLATIFRPRIYMGHMMGSDNYYCLGWALRMNSPYNIVWHNGATLGVNDVIALIPEEKIGIVVLNNLRGAALSEALALQFLDMYLDKPDQDWSKQALKQQATAKKNNEAKKEPKEKWPKLPLEMYIGTYTNSIYGKLEIFKNENGFALKMGPIDVTLDLKHVTRDIFEMEWVPVEERSNVIFHIGEDGATSGLTLQSFEDAEGNGFFKKEFLR